MQMDARLRGIRGCLPSLAEGAQGHRKVTLELLYCPRFIKYLKYILSDFDSTGHSIAFANGQRGGCNGYYHRMNVVRCY